MANYDKWNKAIAEYFVSGLSSGATIYLGADEDALMDIGNSFRQSETDYVDWVQDFKEAVRSECVIGKHVYLERISGYQSDQIPRCVAFLAAMVLAAHHMVAEEAEDEIIIASSNYFKRLRQVLGFPAEDGGRPDGLQTGVEEKLWLSWNWWLIRNGWLPSAERGSSVAQAYINYPLSQALLREADKNSLERRFRECETSRQLSRFWDRDIIGFWVRKQGFGSKYLMELLQESDFRRYDAITDAIYDVYMSINWDQDISQNLTGQSSVQRYMTAGLYREEDALMGTIAYWLYPRQPKQFSGGKLEVIQNGCTYPLHEERPRWFFPLWCVDPAGGICYEVRGHPQIKELILPERKFWILVRDPENESSGIFADWRRPGLGETFLLLCKKEYADQMEIFSQEALLKWDHEYSINEDWMEYRECMIVSPSWEGIIPQHQDLYDALKPTISATISLKGGLRVPNQGGWLEGYAPEMTIFAFDDSVKLKLLDISCPDEFIIDEIANTNKPVNLPPLSPGDYLFETYASGRLATRRALRILPWDSLDCQQPKQPFNVDVGTFTLQGAIFKVTEADRQEDE